MHNFNFYVAGPWADRPNVRTIIEKVEAAGYQTCSRWAEPDNPDVAEDDPEKATKLRDRLRSRVTAGRCGAACRAGAAERRSIAGGCGRRS